LLFTIQLPVGPLNSLVLVIFLYICRSCSYMQTADILTYKWVSTLCCVPCAHVQSFVHTHLQCTHRRGCCLCYVNVSV